MTGEVCPDGCRDDRAARRRARNNVRLGRSSAHWRALSRRARELAPLCADCGGPEDSNEPGLELTVDLVRGGDHRTATLAEVVVRHRSCHGRRDGGRAPS